MLVVFNIKMTDCSICCETFNKSNRCKINCKTCENDKVIACQSCAKRYILEQPTDPSCMVCKVEWDTEFLSDNFTKAFISKELKVHRENYLLDKQIALLPETQEYAEKLKLIDALEKQKAIQLEERKKLEMKLRKMNSHIREIDITIAQIRNTSMSNKQKSEYTFKCPVENCNGFLDSSFCCGICDNQICKHCMEIKEEDHVCDEEKKETVAFLKKDTKPCPKCGQFIHKINGCDQMYCVKCHTAFSWRTGMIERGQVHNPEYYRWMRENGRDVPRDPLDIVYDPCGNNVINYQDLLRILRSWFPAVLTTGRSRYGQPIYNDNPNVVKVANMHRMVHHINFLNENYNADERTRERTLIDMRAIYLLNKITKEEFKKRLQMLEKKNNKNKKLNDIWNVIRLVLIEYIGKISEIQRGEDGKAIISNLVLESEKIRKYCNNSFVKIGNIFKMTYPGISHDWIQINNWETYIKDLEKRKQTHLENSHN